jgi:[acyl-carrier-protein] S-malonyltransferase
MPGTAVLFPGQGAQVLGMGRDAYHRSPAARRVFDLADSLLPFSLSDVVFGGPEERLIETDVSQPAILVTSMALVEAAREAGWKAHAGACAGLSLGEYSALAFSGALALEDAVCLVHRRGVLMREAGRANPGGMLSVIGLADAALDAVLAAAGAAGVICKANLNCPGQVVLSGQAPALEAAAKLASEKGAMKVVMLKVDGAFHSPLMAPAAEGLARALEGIEIRRPSMPIVANASAGLTDDPAAIRRLLVEQLTSPVLWERSMRLLLERGFISFVEIGPGRVLAGLMKRIERKVSMTSVSDMDGVAALAVPAEK